MKYKRNFKNFRLGSTISNWANHVMTLHPIKKEWRLAIAMLVIVKLLTISISLYAGFSFFLEYFLPVIKKTMSSIIVSLITLLLLELLTAVFLEKTFKFFYRGRFVTAILSLIAVSAFYSISFISSTEGLAKKQAEKKDYSIQIRNEANRQKTEQERQTALSLTEFDKQISQIERNPQGWSQGKRDYLTSNQLENIKQLNQKKEKVRKNHTLVLYNIDIQMNSKLSQNTEQTIKTSSQYYKFMSIIMIAQFAVTGILVFFLYLIRSQESKDAVINEDLKEIQSVIETNASTAMFNGVVTIANRLSDLLNNQIENSENSEILEIGKAMQKNPEEYKTPKEIVGFRNQKSAINNPKTLTHVDNKQVLTNKEIAYLKKHKQLVKAIKVTIQPPLSTISNNEVTIIQNRVKNAKHKSYTLVRNVFEVCRAVGIENIDKDGNIIHYNPRAG